MKNTNIFSSILIISALLLSGQAYGAKKYRKLTESNIENFVEETTKMTTMKHRGMPIEDIVAYMEEHVESGAKFKNIMTYTMPGQDPQKTTVELDKSQFIANMKADAQTLEDYQNKTEILSMDVAKDHKTASVKTKSVENGSMKMTNTEDTLPVEGTSVCDQELGLNSEGTIQIQKAECLTTIAVNPAQ